ncbi:toll/interleukin-1 receptor domain-containing protein [Streptomyces sp. FB2]|uniref:toll/interleukin-1 receptor domain-containing protein n=1 Tax=Streptomyces sp. FB2 TaxID=2902454 RepID=UPI001F3D7AE5|nr:toll/interleukin-1 receptor domain-containing protein [Streptomyces sp. FB2]MCF2535300.1 toll/interleukin-1 receptor domain-containing protein [Streptomyces sp. FB2]
MVEAVLASASFSSPASRELLLWVTGEALGRSLLRRGNSSPVLQCVDLIRTCDSEPGGLRVLLEILTAFEPDSSTTSRVSALVTEQEDDSGPDRTIIAGDGTVGVTGARAPSTSESDTGRKDFFVSYTASDRRWAVWIAWELEEAGYSVIVQEWDFVPGNSWQMGMEKGITECDRTLAVLSPSYLQSSVYGRQEWQAALGADPAGYARRLVPVRVAPCTPQGMLASLVFIDLVGLPGPQARSQLLDGIGHARSGRAKPVSPPVFPGQSGTDAAH